MVYRKFILVFILIATAIAAHSQSNQTRILRLDTLCNILAESNKAMGSVTIAQGGKLLFTKTFGYSSINDKAKIAAVDHTKYRIGSVTKMFTATMIFQLIEEGKLTMSTTLDKYFPKLPNAKLITIKHLLSHRSGLYNITNDPDYHQWKSSPKEEEEIRFMISNHPVDFIPDSKASYSNSNFIILGQIIEQVTGKSYKDALRQRIIRKIGLKDTYYGDQPDHKNNESFSYSFNDSAHAWIQEPETDPSVLTGAGSIVSTPADMIKFVEALFYGELISEQSLAQMKTITDGFGMGMFQYPFGNKKAYGHHGNIDGFAAQLCYFPDDSLTIAYCTNGQVYPINDIISGLVSICFDRPYTMPVFKVQAVSGDLTKYIGTYANFGGPNKIVISQGTGGLMVQIAGQAAIPLVLSEKDTFLYPKAGLKIDFIPDLNDLILTQNGIAYRYTRMK